MQKEERAKAIKDLNDIQYELFDHCMASYEKDGWMNFGMI